MKDFDELVDSLLNKSFDSEDELAVLRNKISRKFEIVEILIEQNSKTLELDSSDIKKILDVNAFVEKSETIMRSKYVDLKAHPVFMIKDQYVEKIKDAKRVCFLKAR